MKRIFAAIKIEPASEMISFLYSIKNKLSSERIKWVSHGNIHITLRFFGDTEDSTIDEISTYFHSISSQISPFDMVFDKLGFFGKKNNPKILWVGVKSNENINSLLNLTNKYFENPDQDNVNLYSSHITIARMKNISGISNFMDVIGSEIQIRENYHVDHFTLYESILSKTGAIYSEIDNYYFRL